MNYASQACKTYLKNPKISADMEMDTLRVEINRFWDSVTVHVFNSTDNIHIRNAYQLMIQQARCQCSVINWLDNPELFYSTVSKTGKRKVPWTGIASVLVLLGLLIWFSIPQKKEYIVYMAILGAAAVLELAQLLITYLSIPTAPMGKVRAEQRIIPERVYHDLQQAASQVDNSADSLFAILSENTVDTDGADLSLVQDLLHLPKDQRSSSVSQAIERYLVRQGVQRVEYSEEDRNLFMILPSSKTMTIEPALIKDGIILHLGVACIAEEE